MLGNKIKIIREQAGLSQSDFGKELDVNQRTVSNWESERNEPSIVAIKTMVKKWKVSLSWLILNEGTINPEIDQIYAEVKEDIFKKNKEDELKKVLINFQDKQNAMYAVGLKIEKIKGQKFFDILSNLWTGRGERILIFLSSFLDYLTTQNIEFNPKTLKDDFTKAIENYQLSDNPNFKHVVEFKKSDKEYLLKWVEDELDELTVYEILFSLSELQKNVKKQLYIFHQFAIKYNIPV
ncbi:putative phage transcriptional repressor [Sulfurimonas gotlandica GD1]|uniref:Putative phage transcriptional repressor n=1 Tax=Sulfurimonas gotlandica (strain DSM 19862 / JCM 16533 / GD1) TaxID=929558 RepID=B6BP05_SULGG|nr:helix-turn-helix domain-containing protein [Sulfurimonas gotlandica]EDZ61166.1 putative transcriptional regulator [Sulfurimonas gotlandica GD1]EHP29216.1 putative phage transcriptional repressor [Sulfurimonas gotlandica GD1]